MKIDQTRDFLFKIQKQINANEAIKGPSGMLLEDRKNVLNLKILVGLDVSGSISSEEYRKFMAALNEIRGLSVVKVIEIDTKIVAMYDFYKGTNRIVRLQGGGGTEFTPFFQAAKKMKPDCIVMMTDGEVSGSIDNPKIPTGWILTSDGRKPYTWGDVIARLP